MYIKLKEILGSLASSLTSTWQDQERNALLFLGERAIFQGIWLVTHRRFFDSIDLWFPSTMNAAVDSLWHPSHKMKKAPEWGASRNSE
jgi:hypothetical protein